MSTAPGGTAGVAGPTGFVEAVTADRVLGWAWDPARPAERLRIELRVGDALVAEAVADRPRDDLAAGGIGDGAHAFALSVPPAHRARAAEFAVTARGEGGTAALAAPGTPAAGAAEAIARLERGMQALVGSQRLLHRNLQAVLLSVREAPASAPAEGEERTREELRRQVEAIELFVTRLDERLAGMAEAGPVRAAPTGARAWLAAVLGLVAGGCLAAAAASLPLS